MLGVEIEANPRGIDDTLGYPQPFRFGQVALVTTRAILEGEAGWRADQQGVGAVAFSIAADGHTPAARQITIAAVAGFWRGGLQYAGHVFGLQKGLVSRQDEGAVGLLGGRDMGRSRQGCIQVLLF